jgi:hypothetical protein
LNFPSGTGTQQQAVVNPRLHFPLRIPRAFDPFFLDCIPSLLKGHWQPTCFFPDCRPSAAQKPERVWARIEKPKIKRTDEKQPLTTISDRDIILIHHLLLLLLMDVYICNITKQHQQIATKIDNNN